MSEHRIPLRRAWEGPHGRFDLPRRPDAPPVPRWLARRFHRPPLDPRERLSLELIDVPGLSKVIFNGTELGLAGGHERQEVALEDPLPRANTLRLEVDDPSCSEGLAWGRIALVIRTR